MDSRWSQLPLDSVRDVQLLLFAPSVSYPAILAGTADEEIDLSQFVTRLWQTDSDLTATLKWHTELSGSSMPRSGQHVAVYLNSALLCIHTIDAISDYRRSPGNQSMTLTARTRDSFPAWRSVPRATHSYPLGTPIEEIADDAVSALGLTDAENLLGTTGVVTPHSSVQLAQVSAWTILEQALFAAGEQPFVDAVGRLKSYGRDVFRASTLVLEDERVLDVVGSKSRAPSSRLLLKWRSPNAEQVLHQDQALASATITAGFFQLQQRQEVWWSEDRTQRALDTRLVIKQSANGGLIPVCAESYGDNGEPHTGGTVMLNTLVYVPLLIALYVPSKIALAAVPEPVEVAATVPWYGRVPEAAADIFILTLLASIGTGVYEIWGTPYDFVTPINQTEVYDPDATSHVDSLETLENDFIADEGHAQSVARTEFVYRARSASSFGLELADDPRIEPGDILELPDGSRVFVTGFARDLTPGTAARLEISGFPA